MIDYLFSLLALAGVAALFMTVIGKEFGYWDDDDDK